MDVDYTVIPSALVLIALTLDAICLRHLRRLSIRGLSPRRTLIRRILSFAAAILVTTLASWCAYNAIATHIFWAKHPPARDALR